MRTQPLFLALLLSPLLALATGCDDGPTKPIEMPVELAGELEPEGSTTYPLDVLDSGTVAFDMTSIERIDEPDPEDPEDPEDPDETVPPIGFALGRPSGDDCAVSSRVAPFAEGDRVLFELGEGAYCVTVFDPGTLPDESRVAFVLTISSRFD